MANYDNSSLEVQLTILEDLEYYMHQIDNARDFVSLNGLTKIILPALQSLDKSEELVAKSAILLGSSAQANDIVQVSQCKNQGEIFFQFSPIIIGQNLWF